MNQWLLMRIFQCFYSVSIRFSCFPLYFCSLFVRKQKQVICVEYGDSSYFLYPLISYHKTVLFAWRQIKSAIICLLLAE